MVRLPNETLELVLDYASTDVLLGRYERPASRPAFHTRGLRMRWLASIQLVSRQFLKVVRSFAYNEVAVSSANQLELLTDHLDRNPNLALKSLSLIVFASGPQDERRYTYERRRSLEGGTPAVRAEQAVDSGT